MPYSANILDKLVLGIIESLLPLSVIDIGAGAGKYGTMIKQSQVLNNCRLTGIEIDETYIREYALEQLYDQVINSDALALIDHPSTRADLVIIGDCIEHLRKSDGQDLIEFLLYRSSHVLIVYPQNLPQDDWEGHAQEAHISIWNKSSFCHLDAIHYEHDMGNWSMNIALIKGCMPSPMNIKSISSKFIHYARNWA